MDDLMADSEAQVQQVFNDWLVQFNAKLNEIVNQAAAPLVEHIFSDGSGGGRGWAPNTPSTLKRKGQKNPNVDTGDLEAMLSEPGFIQQPNYVEQLPPSKAMTTNGGRKTVPRNGSYLEANKVRPFDNIGETDEDERFVESIIEKGLQSEYN